MTNNKKPVFVLASDIQHLPELYDGLFKVSEDGKIYRRKGNGKYYVLAPQSKTSRDNSYLQVTAMVDSRGMPEIDDSDDECRDLY